MLRSRLIEILNVPLRVRLRFRLVCGLVDDLFEHPEKILLSSHIENSGDSMVHTPSFSHPAQQPTRTTIRHQPNSNTVAIMTPLNRPVTPTQVNRDCIGFPGTVSFASGSLVWNRRKVNLPSLHRREAYLISHCARRTSIIHLIDTSKLACFSLLEGHPRWLSAAVERGPSQGARSGSTGPTWALSHPSIVRIPRAGGRLNYPPILPHLLVPL